MFSELVFVGHGPKKKPLTLGADFKRGVGPGFSFFNIPGWRKIFIQNSQGAVFFSIIFDLNPMKVSYQYQEICTLGLHFFTQFIGKTTDLKVADLFVFFYQI